MSVNTDSNQQQHQQQQQQQTTPQQQSDIVIICPHCNEYIIIDKLNCCIFRHGTFIHNGQQINAHTPKIACDNLVKNGIIYGCGKPFRIIVTEEDEVIISSSITPSIEHNNNNIPQTISTSIIKKKIIYTPEICDYI